MLGDSIRAGGLLPVAIDGKEIEETTSFEFELTSGLYNLQQSEWSLRSQWHGQANRMETMASRAAEVDAYADQTENVLSLKSVNIMLKVFTDFNKPTSLLRLGVCPKLLQCILHFIYSLLYSCRPL